MIRLMKERVGIKEQGMIIKGRKNLLKVGRNL